MPMKFNLRMNTITSKACQENYFPHSSANDFDWGNYYAFFNKEVMQKARRWPFWKDIRNISFKKILPWDPGPGGWRVFFTPNEPSPKTIVNVIEPDPWYVFEPGHWLFAGLSCKPAISLKAKVRGTLQEKVLTFFTDRKRPRLIQRLLNETWLVHGLEGNINKKGNTFYEGTNKQKPAAMDVICNG